MQGIWEKAASESWVLSESKVLSAKKRWRLAVFYLCAKLRLSGRASPPPGSFVCKLACLGQEGIHNTRIEHPIPGSSLVGRSCRALSGLWNSCREQTLSISGAAFLLGRPQQCFPTSRQQSDWWSPWRAGLPSRACCTHPARCGGRTAASVSRCNPFAAARITKATCNFWLRTRKSEPVNYLEPVIHFV